MKKTILILISSILLLCNIHKTKAQIISAGLNHSLAICSDSVIWAWGGTGNGELGNGSDNNSFVPVQVNNLSAVISVSAGGQHSLALKNDGSVWAWEEMIMVS